MVYVAGVGVRHKIFVGGLDDPSNQICSSSSWSRNRDKPCPYKEESSQNCCLNLFFSKGHVQKKRWKVWSSAILGGREWAIHFHLIGAPFSNETFQIHTLFFCKEQIITINQFVINLRISFEIFFCEDQKCPLGPVMQNILSFLKTRGSKKRKWTRKQRYFFQI